MFTTTKNDIHAWPFAECANMTDAAQLESWSLQHGLVNCNSWMLPQILAYFGQLRVRQGSDGLLDGRALVIDNFKDNDWALGLYRLCTKMKRSALVKTQSNAVSAHYSALVPLVLAGIKKYQNTDYSSWSKTGLQYATDAALYAAMTCSVPDTSRDRRLELRSQGLTVASGPKAGTLKNAASTWTLTGLKHTEWGQLPPLALTMLSQIWVAHPGVRNTSMVLDPQNWDVMPDILIPVEVVRPAPATPVADMPW